MSVDRIRNRLVGLVAFTVVWIWAAAPVWAAEPFAVLITNPKYDSEHAKGEKVFFTASVKKAGGEVKDVQLVWASNLDGKIGTGAALTTDTLSVGLHRITLDVFDTSGIVGSETIKIKVRYAKSGGQDEKGRSLDTGSGTEAYTPNPFN